MRQETRHAMEMLFVSKWNLPKAAEYCNLTEKECKIVFNEYCNFHPAIYTNEDRTERLVDFDQYDQK